VREEFLAQESVQAGEMPFAERRYLERHS